MQQELFIQCFCDLPLKSDELTELSNKINTVLEERQKEADNLSQFVNTNYCKEYKKAAEVIDRVRKFFQSVFPYEAIRFAYDFESKAEIDYQSGIKESGSKWAEDGELEHSSDSEKFISVVKIYYAGRDAIGEVDHHTLEIAQSMIGKLFDCKFSGSEYNHANRGGYEIMKVVGPASPYYHTYRE
jgi:hypothetical protein